MKSQPAFYAGLVSAMYRDIAQCYSVPQGQQKAELRKIEERSSAEGFSFYTKTLPAYGKAVDTALSTGRRFATKAFSKRLSNSEVPQFLGWLLNRVFTEKGRELETPDPLALKHFRQLVYLLYKLEIPYEKKTEETVISSFVYTDAELAQYDLREEAILRGDSYSVRHQRIGADEWLTGARAAIARVIAPLDPTGINPCHGPGAVATGEDILEKTFFKRIYSEVEKVYPFTEYMMFNLEHVAEAIKDGDLDVVCENIATAKVVLVPKDSRGPRLISCEPLEIQWLQQGLKRILVERIESFRDTSGFVNFTDQGVNRKLALQGSKDGRWVTLDMKDASDRVSLSLVKYLFQDNPKFLAALIATRSGQTRLPNGQIVTLNKFAPMGSALCFPVEALIFWALSVSAIRCTWPETARKRRLDQVYVYGDDIIVSDKVYTTLLQHLPLVGLKFNEGKCCTARFFRESCGCDAYDGVDVTPIKLKTVWSPRRSNTACLESYVALSNAMQGLGYTETAHYVATKVEEVWGRIPYTNNYSTSPNGAWVAKTAGVAWCIDQALASKCNRLLPFIPRRWNSALHREEVRTWSSVPLKRKTKADGYAEMLRRQSDGYGSHGGVYAITRRNRLNRVWMENL